MSYGRISDSGFARIVQATNRHEGQWFQQLKDRLMPGQQPAQAVPPPLPAQQGPEQDFQADISNLYQLIESYGESMTLTQTEVEELKSQVDFIESYVYDTANQPRPDTSQPASQNTDTAWYDEYLKQVSEVTPGEPVPSPAQFLAT